MIWCYFWIPEGGGGGQGGPVPCAILLGLPDDEGGGAAAGEWLRGPRPTGGAVAFPEDAHVAAERLQEGRDVDLLQRLLAVVHGRQHVLGAYAIRLLQAAVHT